MKARLLTVILGLLMVAVPFLYATSLSVIGPTSAVLHNNQSVFLGKVGPGESFYVLASASTPNATGYVVNIGWDQLEAVNLPQGWISQPSPLYENPMNLKITVPQGASNGIYNLTLKAVNVENYSRLGNITVVAIVNVTPNVFTVSVEPTSIQSGVSQPTNMRITINNTGISDDPYSISLHGLPAWNVTDQVVSLHLSKTSYVYPVYVNEPGTYKFNISVSSVTSRSLHVSYPVSLTAQDSLLNDYRSVGQGVLLSPVIFDPSYELMLFLSYIYAQLTGN